MSQPGNSALRRRPGFRAAAATPGSERSEGLSTAFTVMSGALLLFLAYSFVRDPSWRVLGSLFVVTAAMFPAYLWCTARVSGVPIFPLFAFTFVWTYAYPLASRHPIVLRYSDEAALYAAATVTIFLLLSTLAWFVVVTSARQRRTYTWAMAPERGAYFFSVLIILASLLTLSVVGGWFAIPSGVFSIIRAALFGLSSVGIFVLAYRLGRRQLRETETALFGFALGLYLISQSMTLYLISAIVAALLALVGFTVGRRSMPWRSALVLLAIFGVLHLGKGEMRQRYWYPAPEAVQIWEYPAFMLEWAGAGFRKTVSAPEDEQTQPLFERLSLVHLLLKVQHESPDLIPYLEGQTYAVIPGLLVPRALDPEKLAAHEGTRILNIHYGLQTREEVEQTTIGWGLLNEAAANFALPGVIVLAVLLGALYGWVTKLAIDMPILSLKTLVAITFLAFAAQTEFTAGVYVSALFQSLVSLFGTSFLLMSERQLGADDA